MATKKKTKKKKSAARSPRNKAVNVPTFRDLILNDTQGRKPAEIAEAADVSKTYLYALMNGSKSNPKPWTIRKIAKPLRRKNEKLDAAAERVTAALAKTARSVR